jgi:hypothetical protein
MRPQCRGCCLSRSAVPEDWGRYDLSNVPRRMGEMRLTVVVVRAQCAEFLTQRHILSMKRGNDQKIALIARRVQGIGSGFILNQTFENTSNLFICAGNKNSGAVFSLPGKPLRPSLHSRVVSTTCIKRLFCCRNATGNQVSRIWIETQKRFIFAEEFLHERDGSKATPMTSDSANVNRTRL